MARALTRAFFSLLHPRMLWVMVWPVLVSLAVWLVLAVAFWSQAAQWMDARLMQSAAVQWMLDLPLLAFIAANLSTVVLVLLFIPLVLVTAVIIIGVFAMPQMVAQVAGEYPALERRQGGTFAGSVWNSVAAVAVFLLLVILTLPLWLLPFLWPVLPVLLFGYLNQRVLRYDAFAEHASGEEMRLLLRRHRGELYLLGVTVALVGYVPLLGLFAAVYGGLVFIHFALDRLQSLRAAAIEGRAPIPQP